MKRIPFRALLPAMLLIISLTAANGLAKSNGNTHTSKPFMGVKANTGTVTHTKQGNQNVLTLSDDFIVPDAPAPSWRIVDSKGNLYLLQQMKIKGDRFNRMIVVPAYVKDIAKVQVWCSWAETLLGETTFDAIIKL
jgi:hypothetical protein